MVNECVLCACELAGKPVQYKCDCNECGDVCSSIEFDEVPNTVPYCCGLHMKRVK